MSDENPSIMSHVSIGTNDYARAVSFYDKVLGAIGCRRIMEHGEAVAYGKEFPEFWVQTPIDGNPATAANGGHFAFLASSLAAVDAFYRAAIDAGAADDGPPGYRHIYSDAYYGGFVRDLDGHKIEAMYWDAEKAG